MSEDKRRWYAVDRPDARTLSGRPKPPLTHEEALAKSLEALEYLARSGALDALVELASTLKMVRDVVVDEMVEDLGKTLGELGSLVDGVTRTPIPRALVSALNDPEVDKALLEAASKKISITKLIYMLFDDDVKRGLYIVLTILRALGRRAKDFA